jgi:hypothetical protein
MDSMAPKPRGFSLFKLDTTEGTLKTPPKLKREADETSSGRVKLKGTNKYERFSLSMPLEYRSTPRKKRRPRTNQNAKSTPRTPQRSQASNSSVSNPFSGSLTLGAFGSLGGFGSPGGFGFSGGSQETPSRNPVLRPPQRWLSPRGSQSESRIGSQSEAEDEAEVDWDLNAVLYRIRLNHREVIPDYWEALQLNPVQCVRISSKCFILQDWNDRKRSLVVVIRIVFLC